MLSDCPEAIGFSCRSRPHCRSIIDNTPSAFSTTSLTHASMYKRARMDVRGLSNHRLLCGFPSCSSLPAHCHRCQHLLPTILSKDTDFLLPLGWVDGMGLGTAPRALGEVVQQHPKPNKLRSGATRGVAPFPRRHAPERRSLQKSASLVPSAGQQEAERLKAHPESR